ncbi:MAG: hypothetical protein JO224_01590 [Pelomonas sp.]|nr:hypothetical protein [Roseateles sp.]
MRDRVLLAGLAGLTLLGLGGCATHSMPEPTASFANVEKLRTAQIRPAMVGTFMLAAGKPKDMDTTLGGLRSTSLAPAHGSFALQLRDTLVAELKNASLYDGTSPALIEGQLTDSFVDAAIGTSSGRLAARFTIKRDGHLVFDKELVVDEQWDGSFMGPVAIPDAIRHYEGLYHLLIGKLIDEPDFRAALVR